jgi:hypothetical protein
MARSIPSSTETKRRSPTARAWAETGRIGVVVGQHQPRNHEQVVTLARPARLVVDLGEIGPVVRGGDSLRRICEIRLANVIGDAQPREP